MQKRFRIRLYAALLLLEVSAKAQAATGSEGGSFLEIPVGAAPAALGSAYTALATDAYAPVWNPAGLGFSNGVRFSAMEVPYLQSTRYEYFGAAVPLGPTKKNRSSWEGLAVSVQRVSSGEITSRDDQGNATGSYDAAFAAYSLAYGLAFNDRWSAGVTAKAITESIADASAHSFAGDLGALYRTGSAFSLGLNLTNVGAPIRFVSAGDPLPAALHVGVASLLVSSLEGSAEAVYRNTGSLSGSAGLQWTYERMISLRVGVNTSHTDGSSALTALSMGVGLHFFGQEFSYAWVPYGDLGSANYFSLDLHFGGTEEAAAPHLKPVRKQKAQPDHFSDFDDDPFFKDSPDHE